MILTASPIDVHLSTLQVFYYAAMGLTALSTILYCGFRMWLSWIIDLRLKKLDKYCYTLYRISYFEYQKILGVKNVWSGRRYWSDVINETTKHGTLISMISDAHYFKIKLRNFKKIYKTFNVQEYIEFCKKAEHKFEFKSFKYLTNTILFQRYINNQVDNGEFVELNVPSSFYEVEKLDKTREDNRFRLDNAEYLGASVVDITDLNMNMDKNDLYYLIEMLKDFTKLIHSPKEEKID